MCEYEPDDLVGDGSPVTKTPGERTDIVGPISSLLDISLDLIE
jgi:hypothetical protein